MQGRGIDRHLFGLRSVLGDMKEVPALFNDEVLSKSSTWVLSTSQLSHPRIAAWGYGEVTPNGRWRAPNKLAWKHDPISYLVL